MNVSVNSTMILWATALSLFPEPSMAIAATPNCPAPLIPQPLFSTMNPNRCLDNCCAPTPIEKLLIDDGEYQLHVHVLPLISLLSALGALFVALSYTIIPSLRRLPGLWVAAIAIAECMRSMAEFLIFIPSIQTRQELYPSTPASSSLCLASSSLAIFGAIASLKFMLILIISLHLNLIWMKNVLEKYWYIVLSVLLIVCVGLTVDPLMHANIVGEGSHICFIPKTQLSRYIYMPVVPLAILGAICFLGTIASIIRTTYRIRYGNGETSWAEFRARIRPFFPLLLYILVGMSLLILLVCMSFIPTFKGVALTTDDYWVKPYVECLMSGGTECEAMRIRPKPYLTFIFRLILIVYRSSLCLCFGFRSVVVREWKLFLHSKFGKTVMESGKSLPDF